MKHYLSTYITVHAARIGGQSKVEHTGATLRHLYFLRSGVPAGKVKSSAGEEYELCHLLNPTFTIGKDCCKITNAHIYLLTY